jgi:glutamate synthase (NADPH/NADH) large chain
MRSALSSCRRTRRCAHFKKIIAEVVAAEGQVLLGFRDVPVDNSSLSKAPEIAATEPVHVQVFIGQSRASRTSDDFERRLFVLRKVISNRVYGETDGGDKGFYFVSLSTRRSSTRACSWPTRSAPITRT